MSEKRAKAIPPINDDFLLRIKDGFDHAVETERRELAGEPVQPPPYPPRMVVAVPAPLKALKDPKKVDTNRVSLSSHPDYTKAGFFLDRDFLKQLAHLATDTNLSQSYLMNPALYNLLVEFKPELADQE